MGLITILHSKVYTDAQIQNNIQTMKNEMAKDFQTAKRNGFTVVKTFYSIVATVNGQNTAMADIALSYEATITVRSL
ncbi:hypothetical protein [Legionella sp.]|uniref:hypothetical protein n=1 Tax=Legionella sp. TaxID=459 RepID=UPI003C96136F